MAMRIYSVHERPVAWGEDRDVMLIKEGFSWPAFLVPLLWTLYHRLWLGVLVYLGGAALIGVLLELLGADKTSQTAAAVGFAVLVAFEANDWRRRALARRGYQPRGVVAGVNLDEAEHRFFADSAPARPRQPAPPPPSPAPAAAPHPAPAATAQP